MAERSKKMTCEEGTWEQHKSKSLNAFVQLCFSCLTSAIEKCRIKQDNIFDVLNWEELISLVILSVCDRHTCNSILTLNWYSHLDKLGMYLSVKFIYPWIQKFHSQKTTEMFIVLFIIVKIWKQFPSTSVSKELRRVSETSTLLNPVISA